MQIEHKVKSDVSSSVRLKNTHVKITLLRSLYPNCAMTFLDVFFSCFFN